MAKHDILIHQPSIDLHDSRGSVYANVDTSVGLLDTQPHDLQEQLVFNAMKQVINLKSEAGTNKDRVYDVSQRAVDNLSEDRSGPLMLARDVTRQIKYDGANVSWYGLADVREFITSRVPYQSLINAKHARGSRTYIRLEESLALSAHRLLSSLPEAPATDEAHILPKKIVGGKAESLYGYTFNRNSQNEADRISLPHLPGCEAFIAATVLDQVGLVPAVLRVVPYSLKDREVMARNILRDAGHANLPVISVITGQSGDVDKIIRWSKVLPDVLEDTIPTIRERQAHYKSKSIGKNIHDELFAEHRELYEEFCRPDLESNISPVRLLSQSLYTARAHEFLSRNMQAAPLYEETKFDTDKVADLSAAILTLQHLFSRNYQNKTLDFPRQEWNIRHFPGKNTNNVAYISTVLASRPEEDPVLNSKSSQIDLIMHAVFEGLDTADIPKPEGATINAMSELLASHTPRYVLLEARRCGTDLPRLVMVNF